MSFGDAMELFRHPQGESDRSRFLNCDADKKASATEKPGDISESTQADWKREFDRICAQVPIAGDLSTEQLRQLILDCDNLTEVLERSELIQAILFIRTLERCRAYFEDTIDLRQMESEAPVEE